MSDGQQATAWRDPADCVACQAAPTRSKPAAQSVCAIYSLADLGDDGDLGKWAAATIREVVEPESWCWTGGPGQNVVRYYAPKKILVVYNTPAVQAKVEGFLKDVKKALPRPESQATARQAAAKDRAVVRATYQTPAVVHAAEPAPAQPFTYPVPPPVAQPKHLFHFIIRYEGAGIIDSNVVRFMKAQNEQKQSAAADNDNSGPRGVIKAITGGTPAPTPPLPEPDRKKESENSLAPSDAQPGARPVKKDKDEKKETESDKG
jgi:hypothetical protein